MMKRSIVLLIPIVLLIITVSIAAAQSSSGYDPTWSTIDGGGGESVGSDYSLVGTLGQPDAGMLSGGGYTLNGGFWGSALSQYGVYLPLMIR
jgi:hypothetical protein